MSNIIWELDFYSRPILDEDKKKRWEVLICESSTTIDRSPDSLFQYSQYCSNQTVNSIWLKEAIAKAINQAEAPPKKIRFFRRQMNNMITKACNDIGITAVPSRRTYALHQLLEKRIKEVYPHEAGYDAKAAKSASVKYPAMNAVPLPDAVRGDKGDKWAFVTLEASAFAEMKEWDISFGEAFPLSLANITPETQIPGLIVYSPRAIPLAAWMSGLEMGWLGVENGAFPRLLLETGVSDNWVLVNLTNPQTVAEAEKFTTTKARANGVHFLAVQSSSDSDSFAGFWLLKE